MAQDATAGTTNDNSTNTTTKVIDRYVARYVTSQAMMPSYLRNSPPPELTLYNTPDDFVTFLGSPALDQMTAIQANVSINVDNETHLPNDPYLNYLGTCQHGSVHPLLPQIELEFLVANNDNNTDNSTTDDDDNNDWEEAHVKLQYKVMAVPKVGEQAFSVLPQLQKKFQGHGAFNIIAGPYCYENDPVRGYSFDFFFDKMVDSDSDNNTATTTWGQTNNKNSGTKVVRGCMEGYPCAPPAAMGGIPGLPGNHSCDNNDHNHHHHDNNDSGLGVSNLVLSIACYSLFMALLVSIIFHFQLSNNHKHAAKRNPRTDLWQDEAGFLLGGNGSGGDNDNGNDNDTGNDDTPTALFSRMKNSSNHDDELTGDATTNTSHHQNEAVNPFGDLDQMEAADPLQEPLLPVEDPNE